MLREQLGTKRLRFTDGQRRRLAVTGKELATRRVELAGIIRQPHGAWMLQVARNLLDIVDGFLTGKRFLLLDRDPLYTSQFLALLPSAGVTLSACRRAVPISTLTALELEAAERPEAQRILDRIASIQAEVGRRLRAGSGTPDEGGEDGADDDEPGAGPGEGPADEAPHRRRREPLTGQAPGSCQGAACLFREWFRRDIAVPATAGTRSAEALEARAPPQRRALPRLEA